MDILIWIIIGCFFIALGIGDLVFNFLGFALKVIVAVVLSFIGFFFLLGLLTAFTPIAFIVGVVAFLMGVIWLIKLIFKDAKK